tara:strand:+ start:45 stop:578 length:534 start_codon:yes stop_codon:yes gene_type:complete
MFGINKAKVHPIDPRELDFGSLVTPEQIESAYRVSRNDYKDFNIARMQMRGFIEKRLPDILGCRVFVKNSGDGLRILKPNEVSDEMETRNQKAIRSIRKSQDVGADTSQLPDLTAEERIKLTQQLAMSSVMNQAYLRGLKKKKDLLPSPIDERKSFLPEEMRKNNQSDDEAFEEKND